MKIYIDSNFVCHIADDGTMREFNVPFFDGKDKPFVEGFRYVPKGETWTRQDGRQFSGEMIAPAKDYNRIMLDVALHCLDDDDAETVAILFEDWQTGIAYEVDDRKKYEGLLYRCVQAHTSQADWTPPTVPALWVRTSTEEWPEWVQPTGTHDAYNKNEKVSHNGKHWTSDIDANVYEPGVYGWSEAE